jgi:hypothetical protein
MLTDNNDDDVDDDNDNNNDNNEDNDDNDNNDNNDDNDNHDGNGNGNNNNSTIKQCTGVRKRRKMVAAMDEGQRQKWQLLRRNSAWGSKEEECMTIDNS